MKITSDLGGYIAEDGLLKLRLDDNAPPFAGDLMTTHNENGVLFLAYYCRLDNNWAHDQKDQINETIAYLESFGRKGLYDRNHGNQRLRNAKDNYLGILSLSVQLGLRYHGDIYEYGRRHAWNFQNIKTDLPRIETQMQGSFSAIAKACVREKISLIEKGWLAGAICWSTDVLQVWLMTQILDNVGYRDKMYLLARGKFLKRFNLRHEVGEYFKDPMHPCRRYLGV